MAFLTPRRSASVSAALLCAVLRSTGPADAQTSEAGLENDVKAAFLYNFAKYVEWPAGAFHEAGADSFRICVVSDAGFVKRVDAIIAGETIDGRAVTRLTPQSPEAARECHILFLARAEVDRSRGLLAAVQGTPVLTVSDAPDFIDRGGAIAFVRDGDRLRFDVNLSEAQRGGLAVSSRLLRVARRVLPSGAGQ